MEKLSIVLPCYNPQEGWEQRILEAYNSISEQLGFTPAIILVNDGSSIPLPKDAIDFLESSISQFRYAVYIENKGKGYALRYGRIPCSNRMYHLYRYRLSLHNRQLN